MMRVRLKGIHRVKSRLADGTVREYHYAWRGGPLFWRSDSQVPVGGPAYLQALGDAAPAAQRAAGTFRAVILRYLDSADFKTLAPRTQKDIRGSINHPANGIDKAFGSAPLAAFDDKRIRRRALEWRDGIGGKVGDTRIRHLQQIVAWAFDRGDLETNRLTRIKSTYRSNRADVLWTDAEIDALIAGSPPHVGRIVIAATETGLRPGDLCILSRFHVQETPHGRRIVLTPQKTEKRRQVVSVPVTQRMADLIDATPKGETILLRGLRGRPYSHANYLGDAVSDWRDKINARARAAGRPVPIRPDLRLYDARGTAATRLLNAGAEIREIATAMGWSIKRATEVIERYVALHPDMTDALGAKIAKLEREKP